MHCGGLVVPHRKGRTNTRVHATAQEHYRARSLWGCHSLQDCLHAFERRIPDELVKLQSEARWHVVSDDPFRQLLWIEETVRTVPQASSILAKSRRKQNCIHLSRKVVTLDEVPGKFVVAAAA